MSVTVGYFFNSDTSLAQLARDVNRVLGCSFAPYDGEDEDLYCRHYAMEFSLWTPSGFQNDRDLNFEDYRYELELRTPAPDGDLRPIQISVMALAAFALHMRLGIHTGILVCEEQVLLARYDLLGDDWRDLVSGKRVQFPDHLVDVYSRAR